MNSNKFSIAEHKIVELALEEDLGESPDPKADATSQLLDSSIQASGLILGKEAGVLAGRRAVELSFQLLDPEIDLTWQADDGDLLSPNASVCEISGSLASICAGERVALNFISHLSGVATLTRKYVEAAVGKTAIFDTRKTTPGLRSLEKAAVIAGGGNNHRFSLRDAVLIKDNHLIHLSIQEAVQKARTANPNLFVEVECDSIKQVSEALTAKADAILLDNMDATQIKECVDLIDGQCITEASGGVELGNIPALTKTGVTRISVGAITKSAPALDFSLEITKSHFPS